MPTLVESFVLSPLNSVGAFMSTSPLDVYEFAWVDWRNHAWSIEKVIFGKYKSELEQLAIWVEKPDEDLLAEYKCIYGIRTPLDKEIVLLWWASLNLPQLSSFMLLLVIEVGLSVGLVKQETWLGVNNLVPTGFYLLDLPQLAIVVRLNTTHPQ